MATEYIRNVARIVTVAVCILCCLTVNDVSGSDAEERLRYDLFHNYNATVRPAEKPGDTVVIDIALAITQILDVDEKRQVVTGNLWIYQIWTDFRLKWDPADYDGIFNLPVQSKQIWFPDTALYQSANEEHVNYPTVIALNIIGIIHNDGSVTVCTAHVYELPCVMAITTFPFDTQTCPVYFGTWVHFVQDLDFKAHFDGVERESFIANTEWEITGSEANRYEGSFLTFAGNYSYLEFLIHIERKPI
uniref:Neuronal acetylcholine receptor subunit alpha-6-like n=1 Tax=Saccoglossus kowalevskii TaxID=10224 RepID=A0ABM0LVD7_SACKO|nr:PREDICTED: neuronal acetylcholine receptor subunit alpha-6-like [Saccoglossus kowalevskii]